MASFVACFVNAISRWIPRSSHQFHHPYPPSVMHALMDQSFIENFESVFVIGDIHGCFDELLLLLRKAEVEDIKTLKIFVGDLVNKGPKSKEVLDFLMKSNSMFSVRGNHDEVVMREYFDSKKPGYTLSSKNKWIQDLSEENIKYLENMPYTISIPSLNSIVVHAGLIPGVPPEATFPHLMLHMRNIQETDYFWEGGFKALSDASAGKPWASVWGGPQHVYFGHDAKRMLQLEHFATGLDTGCVYGNWLTGLFISGPRKGEMVQVKALKVYSEPKSPNKRLIFVN